MIYLLDCIGIMNAQTIGIFFQCNTGHAWLDYFTKHKIIEQKRFSFFIHRLCNIHFLWRSVFCLHSCDRCDWRRKTHWYSPHDVVMGSSNGNHIHSSFRAYHQRFESLNRKAVATSWCLALHLHHTNSNLIKCLWVKFNGLNLLEIIYSDWVTGQINC